MPERDLRGQGLPGDPPAPQGAHFGSSRFDGRSQPGASGGKPPPLAGSRAALWFPLTKGC